MPDHYWLGIFYYKENKIMEKFDIIKITDYHMMPKFDSDNYYGWRVFHSENIQSELRRGPEWLIDSDLIETELPLKVYILEGPDVGKGLNLRAMSGTEIIFIFCEVSDLKWYVPRGNSLDYGKIAPDLISYYRRKDGYLNRFGNWPNFDD